MTSHWTKVEAVNNTPNNEHDHRDDNKPQAHNSSSKMTTSGSGERTRQRQRPETLSTATAWSRTTIANRQQPFSYTPAKLPSRDDTVARTPRRDKQQIPHSSYSKHPLSLMFEVNSGRHRHYGVENRHGTFIRSMCSTFDNALVTLFFLRKLSPAVPVCDGCWVPYTTGEIFL